MTQNAAQAQNGVPPAATSSSPASPAAASCSSSIPAHATQNYEPLAGCKDYHETDAQGQKVLDTTVSPPQPIDLNFSGTRGRFDASYSPSSKVIKAGIKVKLKFVDWHRTDSTGAVLLDTAGAPVSVPFDSDQESDVAIQSINVTEVARTPNMTGTSSLKTRIEGVLNQNGYKLTPAACARGEACACKISIAFDVSFVLSGDHHEEMKMFPRVVRANSGSMGEVSVIRNPSPSAALLQPYLPTSIDNVGAHELGHLFGWPDEYFLHGGAVHGRYIKPDKTVDVSMAEPVDDWQRDSAVNLMGQGMWTQSPQTPKYYMNHVRDWFNSKTGMTWETSL